MQEDACKSSDPQLLNRDTMKFAVIRFGGSNCDSDVHHILNDILSVPTDLVWYKDSIEGYDGVVIPGGFSYGDYLRAGAIAARTPIMGSVRRLADSGKPVIGICNGFQILAESGLLAQTFIRSSAASG